MISALKSKKILIIAIVSLAYLLARQYADQGRQPDRTTTHLPFVLTDSGFAPADDSEKELTASEYAKIRHILKQPFSYMDLGGHSAAYVSEDGKYVLKFFRQKGTGALKNLAVHIDGYQLGNAHFKEQTGLVYLHLHSTGLFRDRVTLKGKLSKDKKSIIPTVERIPLDPYLFVLQKRAVSGGTLLKSAIAEGNDKEAAEILEKIFSLYRNEINQGFLDEDAKMLLNTGFIEGKPVRFDLGRMTPIKAVDSEKIAHLKKGIKSHFRTWLKRSELAERPEVTRCLDEQLNELEACYTLNGINF